MKIMKRSLSILLSVLMIATLFTIVPLTAYADDSNATKIYTVDDLKAINNDLSGNYILMNDIDMSSISDWNPIGDSINYLYDKAQTGATEVEGRNYFSGTLDGNGYSIIGLSFTPVTTTDITENETQYLISYGLFSHISGGEVKNLTFKNININFDNIQNGTDNSYTTYKKKIIYGTLSGSAKNATFSNIKILSGSVSDKNNIVSSGGLVSFDLGDSIYTQISNYINGDIEGGILYSSDKKMSTIQDCNNFGTVDCGIAVGGDLKLKNCFNYAKVNTIGIVRRLYTRLGNEIYIDNCSNYGDISIETNSVGIDCGGLFGEILSSSVESLHIKNCVNKGNINVLYSGDSKGGYLSSTGGIIGNLEIYNSDCEGEVANLENFGRITVTFDNCILSKPADIGGIIGCNNGSFLKNIKCDRLYNYGNIETNSVSCAFIGGLVSSTSRLSISNSVNYGNINLYAVESETSTSTVICIGGVIYCGETGDSSCVGNEGDITINGDIKNVICGGVSSHLYSGDSTTGYSTRIINAYNSGNITINDSNSIDGDLYRIGGISGVLMGTTSDEILLKNICGSGTVNLQGNPQINGKKDIGNIFGINPQKIDIGTSAVNVLNDCYVNPSDAETNVPINIVSKTLDKSSYVGLFDDNNTWELTNGKYPTLVSSPNILFGTTGDCEWLFNKDTGKLIIYGNGEIGYRPTWDGFRDQIKTVEIQYGVKNIISGMFYECTNLKSVTIQNSVTSIGEAAFYNCFNLTSIMIPDSVTSIGESAFRNCTKFESVTISNEITSIEENTFDNCTSLTNITIPNSVTRIEQLAFHGCSSLLSVTIPDKVTYIGHNALNGCSNLTNVTIPSSVTSMGVGMFGYCRKLTNINVDINNPNYTTLDGNLYSKDKKRLIQYAVGKTDTSVTIPNNVKSISNSAFAGCTNLQSVIIPDSITYIGENAFASCSNLKDVFYAGAEDEWDEISIGSYNTILTSATMHYVDMQNPTCSISSTNNLASSQTATLTLSDNVGIAGYYWGTNSNYSSNTFSSTSSTSITKTITSSGTYYLTVKDTSGNVSETKSITFYGTNFNANGGTLLSGTPSYVLTASGNSFTPIAPTRSGFEFVGWNTYNTATTGGKTITPTENITYYAIWQEVPEAPTIATEPPTDVPEPTTEAPEVSTSVPTNPYTETTSSISEVSESITVSPEPTAVAPEPVTEVTEPTTAAPESTTVAPEFTTVAPEPTTIVPEATTVAPTEPTENVVVHSKSKQYITAKSYTKSFGNKSFSLKAKTNGGGKLSYKSSNKKVVTVSSKGKVKIKGCGKATVTINASATPKFFATTKKITITVKPGKVKLKAKKTYTKNGSYCIKQYFAKQKNCDGYEWQLSPKKSFPINYLRSKYLSKSKKYIFQSAAYKGRKYYIRIRAYKKIGKKTVNGKWSKIIVFKT